MEFYTDENVISCLRAYDANNKTYHPITDGINPYLCNPKDLPPPVFHTDGNAYFYEKYVEEPNRSSGTGWMRTGRRDALRDVSEILGYKENFEFVEKGNVTNWKMAKYFLYNNRDSRNKKVIYVVNQ